MRMEEIKYFLEICKYSSLSKAAQTLNISQQGLGQSLKRLENNVGGKLFERNFKGVFLTAYGEKFYERAKCVADAVSELEKFVEQSGKCISEKLKIGIRISNNASAMNSAISSAVDDYRKLRSDIQIEITSDNQNILLDKLVRGELDAVHTIGFVDRDIFVSFPVFTMELLLVADSTFKLQKERVVELSELIESPFVLPNAENGLYEVIVKACKQAGFIPNEIASERSAKMLGYMVHKGYGISFLTQNSADVLCRIYPNVLSYHVKPKLYLEYSMTISCKNRENKELLKLIDFVCKESENNLIADSI